MVDRNDKTLAEGPEIAGLGPQNSTARRGGRGALVAQLMSAQEQLRSETSDNDDRPDVSAGLSEQMRDLMELRTRVQCLSRTAGPLSRVLHGFENEMECMLSEMDRWSGQLSRDSAVLQQEKQAVDAEVVDLETRVRNLEQEIQEQTEAIAVSQSVIRSQEQKLEQVLHSLTSN